MLNRLDEGLKRVVDLLGVAVGFLLAPVVAAGAIASVASTRAWPIYSQERIGRHGERFRLYKLRTMRPGGNGTAVTVSGDACITPVGRMLRSTKVDELPQLVNVLRGDMSLVGPRPDVAGYADRLEGDDRLVLSVRPGITSPASLLLRDEESLLTRVSDPERFNDEVLYPAKTRLNRQYVENWSVAGDLACILRTVLPRSRQPDLVRRSGELAAGLLAADVSPARSGET